MTGYDRVEAERQRPVEHRRELDLLVASQARVGGAAGGVLGDEVLDDVLAESFGQIPDIEGNSEHVGGAPSIVGILECAAPSRTVAQRCGSGGQREVHAGDIVTGIDRTSGRDRRVDAAAHRGENLHRPTEVRPARRARSTTGPISATTESTSASVEVCPRENRNEPRARAGSAPIASSTCEGCATPA